MPPAPHQRARRCRAVGRGVAVLAGLTGLAGGAACAGPTDGGGGEAGASRTAMAPGSRPAPTATAPTAGEPVGSAATGTGASGTSSTTRTVDPPVVAATLPADAFDAADQALERRVRSAGLAGGLLLVMRDGQVLHEHQVGGVTRHTPLAVASTAKWLTAATLMTFVDSGDAELDDPVDRWLPELAGDDPPITLRHLLTHTAGIPDPNCLWSGTGLAQCVRTMGSGPRQYPAGAGFAYGNGDFHVVGRVIEVLGNDDFAAVFQARIGDPLGMRTTTWPGAPWAPSPAAGLSTTADDYSRFLQMLLARGTFDGTRILSEGAVLELTRNQVADQDTAGDYAVGITRIPRYSLGAWPDIVDEGGRAVVVSGNGGRGYYPWVDYATNTYGIVAVQDDRGATLAVPASQAVAVAARDVLRP